LNRLWIDLAPYWDKLRAAADARDKQKKGFSTANYMNFDSNFIGLLAEQVYAIVTGQPLNLDLIISGDGGVDFPGIDIKGNEYWDGPNAGSPWLVNYSDKPLRAAKYVLVGIDKKRKRGFVAGWATREDVEKAKLKNWGYGLRRSIPCHKLRSIETIA